MPVPSTLACWFNLALEVILQADLGEQIDLGLQKIDVLFRVFKDVLQSSRDT